jgi:hypothetical protein
MTANDATGEAMSIALTHRILRRAEANDAITACTTAADAAIAVALELGGTVDEARAAGAAAFCGSLPPLTTRPQIIGYISCLAVAMSLHFIDGRTASALGYLAQLALAAQKEHSQ